MIKVIISISRFYELSVTQGKKQIHTDTYIYIFFGELHTDTYIREKRGGGGNYEKGKTKNVGFSMKAKYKRN